MWLLLAVRAKSVVQKLFLHLLHLVFTMLAVTTLLIVLEIRIKVSLCAFVVPYIVPNSEVKLNARLA